MKKRCLRLILLFGLALSTPAFAELIVNPSGSATITNSGNWDGIFCVSIAWGSDVAGNCYQNIGNIEGEIERVVIKADTGQSSPTVSYDMTLTDRDSLDVLAGLGANLQTTTTKHVRPFLSNGTTYFPMVTEGPLSLNVTNCGTTTTQGVVSRTGTLRVYLRRKW